jgi:LuxR family maltose regulon positive regulatory protein
VLDLLERLLADAEANGRMHSVLEVLLVRALALEVEGDHTAALAALAHALTLVEPEGYVRLFLDEGPTMAALLHEAQRQGLAPAYTAKLLEALSRSPEPLALRNRRGREGEPGVTDTLSESSPVESLTAREREVLQLILDGASNREIAHQLILSVGTVKKYVYNICGKLGVQSRTQALIRARALHLL